VTYQPGRAKTGGRKAGTPNRRTQRFRKEVAESGQTPLEHMLAVLHDPAVDADRRDRMAIAAAPYLHPRLQVVDSTIRAKVEVSALSADKMRAKARQAILEAFAERPLVIEHEPRVIAGRDVAKDGAQANGEDKEINHLADGSKTDYDTDR
jgi:hypothetical protein